LLSSVVIAVVFWTLGHFLPEVDFLARKLGGLTGMVLKPFLYIVPNMTIFAVNDTAAPFPGWHVLAGYAGFYSLVCLAFAWALFRRKEF
ncbi:MAG: hypothetical protein PHW69_09740, partial [Elusimicrobiaceae bacterium]|nr:hypothetical protein [Elusimicrobiaceae bacterium]